MEMNDAHDKNKPHQKLCIIEESDSPELKKLKSTIIKMAAYDPEDRYKAVEVEEILGNITGKNTYTIEAIFNMSFDQGVVPLEWKYAYSKQLLNTMSYNVDR